MKCPMFHAVALLVMLASAASAQQDVTTGCEECCNKPLFPHLNAMLAAHRTQGQYASFGGSCQKGCCQKGCVQKGCCQKGPVQKGCVQKSPVQKSCVQKGPVQKGCCQKSCVQKSACVQKGCCQKSVCQKSVCQKSCCQKSVCQKGVSQKGGCGSARGLLSSMGLFNGNGLGIFRKSACGKGGKGGQGYASASIGYGSNDMAPELVVPGDLPTPVINGSDPFQDDPNPLRATAYREQLSHGQVR